MYVVQTTRKPPALPQLGYGAWQSPVPHINNGNNTTDCCTCFSYRKNHSSNLVTYWPSLHRLG